MSGPLGSSQWMYLSGGFYPFEPTGSLRFEDGDSPKLEITPTTTGNRKKWTFSCWFKRGNSSNGHFWNCNSQSGNDGIAAIYIQSDYIYTYYDTSGTNPFGAVGSAKIRDHSAWYHLVWAVDAANTEHKVWLNGTLISTDTSKYPPNYDYAMNRAGYLHTIGAESWGNTNYFDGYMAEIYHLDGQYKTADDFAETKNGVWVPKDAKGSLTFGTNGFYLPFNSTVVSEGQSTVLYEGTGARRSVQGMGYKPDFLWLKERTGAENHRLFDRVRGVQKLLHSNTTDAEANNHQTVLSYDDDGFTLGTNAPVNNSGDEYVAWAWDAGADQTPTGFGCVVYSGSGSRRPVRDVGFAADLVWIKSRAAQGHNLFDSVRGANKALFPNDTNTEFSDTDRLMSFDSDGFTLGSDTNINNSSNDYVAWCWDAGDGDAVSNTDGDITSTVKASTTHGFSIISFTGNGSENQTVGHGLSSAPEFIILKDRDSNSNNNQWQISSSHIGDKYGYFTTAAFAAGAAMKPTSGDDTTFTTGIGPNQGVINTSNESGDRYIAYCWHSVSGYSKIGTYTGTGSAGNAITGLGFRPAFVMVKRTDSADNWVIFDNVRDPLNSAENYLLADSSQAEATFSTVKMDFDSDGFTLQGSANSINNSSGTYVYMAFAGGLDTIAPVNTDGTIDSRVKASDDTGFSIVRYQGSGTAGDAVGHGLSSAPDVHFIKQLNGTGNWVVYNSTEGATKHMTLNTTNASSAYTGLYNDTEPTSSVVTLGSDVATNVSGNPYIMYCWTATTGKSAFGSYTGNGSATGPEVTGLGFAPGLIIIKGIDAATGWAIQDRQRDGNNPNGQTLFPDLSNAEYTSTSSSDHYVDFNSDGFQVKNTNSRFNTNGNDYIYMAFADGRDASFFHDESGQDNHFEPENVQNYDVVPDSPTNNFATMNPVDKNNGSYAEGNLKATTGTVGGSTQRASYYVSSGKWYYEFQPTSNGGITAVGFESLSGGSYSSHMYQADNGQYYNGSSASSYGATYGNSDIIGIALDADNQTVEFFKNGVSQGELSSSNSGMTAGDEYVPFLSDRNVSQTMTGIFNFGQDDSFAGTVTPGGYTDENERGSFKYPVPSGFLSLCTQNLPDPAIDPAAGDQPEDYFNTVLWTGNGSNADRVISGVGFDPDWVWVKRRSNNGSHFVTDVVRGDGKMLATNATDSEDSNSANGYVSLNQTDGFELTAGSSTNGNCNTNNYTHVAWNWLAGGTAVSNTNGTITSSVSANTKAGFSIVSWDGTGFSAGATVGHGLDKAPELIFPKNRDTTGNWHGYHEAIGATHGILLNAGNAKSDDIGFHNDVEPTSSVFTVGTYNVFNNEYIAYCFHSVPGYSRVGQYEGSGAADGPYIHLGFKPAWLLFKNATDGSTNWYLWDNVRDTSNVVDTHLRPAINNAEGTATAVDFLSNGFKVRSTSNEWNGSGDQIIYVAFAEQPFKYSNAR